jgi:hypothetical protein
MAEQSPTPAAEVTAPRRDFSENRDRFGLIDVCQNRSFEAGQRTVDLDQHDSPPHSRH